MQILISACLLGIPCRYDGQAKPILPQIQALLPHHTLIPYCPEIYGGLPTPRPPAEIQPDHTVRTQTNTDLTDQYQAGARYALHLIRTLPIDCAILKSKSPSCGIGTVYDGTFTHTLIPGDGITAQLLRPHLPLYSETTLPSALTKSPTTKELQK